VSIVDLALRRPYTIVAVLILVSLMGIGAALRMPIDIFPEIDIPVVAVVWTYNGMSAQDIQNRILTLHQRQLASLVDDISRIEAVSYEGVGVEKIYLHEGADVTRAVSQLASSALVVLKYMPPNITPPLVLRYGATDVPIIQLSLSSKSLPDTKLNDLGQNIIRPALAVVHGAEVPYPYGGKPRVIMADLDSQALQARGLSASDVSTALQRQNVILPAGDVKIGDKDYALTMNNSPDIIESINAFPIKQVDGRTVFMRDVAHVHDGFQVQTNSVSVNGVPGALMSIRKTGGVSTLAVIDGVRDALKDIKKVLPADVSVKALFDQSVFVKAALDSVMMSAFLAAGLTALVIILFLGNVRLSVIILAAIPLSIIIAVLFIKLAGQTLNTMTLGGFALAIGILVDNGTVVIENIERHVAMREPLRQAIVAGASEVAVPTFLSTLCICIVFVPVFMLQGTAKYLFSPLSLSVIGSLLASLVLSFTMVPVLFNHLMRNAEAKHIAPERSSNPFVRTQARFEHAFESFREKYRNTLAWTLSQPGVTVSAFAVLIVASALLFPLLGRDFFPQVDAGQMRLHVRAPAGTRLEKTQEYFAAVEAQIRQIIGADQIDVMLDNIGLPYSGINLAYSTSAPVGPGDADIFVNLNTKHTPTADFVSALRGKLTASFPSTTFAFLPADMIGQILNFGLPSPIDIQINGFNVAANRLFANQLLRKLQGIPGAVDLHIHQSGDYPQFNVDVDRTKAQLLGLTEQAVASNMLVSLSGSFQTAPSFWVDPKNGTQYQVATQTPQYRLENLNDLGNTPLSGGVGGAQILSNVATVHRSAAPAVVTHYNATPSIDIYGSVQGVDLGYVSGQINKILDDANKDLPKGTNIVLRGQTQTMKASFNGLLFGLMGAIVLVYMLIVVNFQSLLDPFIIITALPAALAGIVWMLFLTHTTVSVPALTGAIMCMGVATANSVLVVSFARERMNAGDNAFEAAMQAGFTRLRPVLMTALAMIIGMIPMALGLGDGGEQNAPLGRAVIGGLIFATVATLFFVPTVFSIIHGRPASHPIHSAETPHG
jgi:multidrug efflux pump subunit AcrB